MSRWMTPFVKQCIVTFGTSLNMAGATLLMSYSTGLVLQLRKPGSEIPLDTNDESWIASMPAISSLLGSSLTALVMSRYGRWLSQIGSISTLIIGWLIIIFANNITSILLGRFIHGLSMGSSIVLTPIMNAEYSSPKNRGTLMMLPTFLAGLNCLISQTTALYLDWRTNAKICCVFALFNLPIAVFSPESPSWLATKQRYDECRRAFRWLRGDGEEEELTNMIIASESHKLMADIKKSSETTLKIKLINMKRTMMKIEFYKPILIMMHVYTAGLWAGSYLLTTYIFDLIENIIAPGYHEHVLGLNIHRFLGGFIAMYLITKARRRTMFLALSSFNVAVLMATAGYTFAKATGFLSDIPFLGIILLHAHMFAVVTCTMPMPFIICGEIFPSKYKSVASGICSMFLFISTGIYVKAFPFLLKSISIHGAYTLFCGIIVYCLAITYFYLPETKDRTLQQIEEEVTGLLTLGESKSVESLISEPKSETEDIEVANMAHQQFRAHEL